MSSPGLSVLLWQAVQKDNSEAPNTDSNNVANIILVSSYDSSIADLKNADFFAIDFYVHSLCIAIASNTTVTP